MADESLWVWRYEGRSADHLNALSSRTCFPGALIRRGSGFACVHPWPELGDPMLDDCLASLDASPLGRRSLACLEVDAAAREAGHSLFADLTIPESHATLAGPTEIPEGFRAAKIKVKGLPEQVRGFLQTRPDLKWRLDFNGTGEPGMFKDWSDDELAMIDFVEDPFSGPGWDQLPVLTANDQLQGGGSIDVLKPAVQEMTSCAPRTIITSYMDHPLGQCFAAYEAGRWFRDRQPEVCGLQTHHLFEPTAFIEALGPWQAQFQAPTGTGLGFDDLLEQLPWKKLS